ncbi:MAG: DUF4209 domain-containing protein [Tannerellaceae bacterium]|nr:DUF4209 domain-containing protein [Tannerellaceae bacterium]
MLRNIVHLCSGEITTVDDKGDSKWKPLEELLCSPCIREIFNEDDRFLFEHTFSRVSKNIRNDVAHGIYKPFDYTVAKATLVFLCILRLNKVTSLWKTTNT